MTSAIGMVAISGNTLWRFPLIAVMLRHDRRQPTAPADGLSLVTMSPAAQRDNNTYRRLRPDIT